MLDGDKPSQGGQEQGGTSSGQGAGQGGQATGGNPLGVEVITKGDKGPSESKKR